MAFFVIVCLAQECENMNIQILVLLLLGLAALALKKSSFDTQRKRRRDYYRDVYLKSEAWQRKRFVVLRRDNWRCVHCGERATQVHNKRYAKINIGREPIEWLESVCKVVMIPCIVEGNKNHCLSTSNFAGVLNSTVTM